jgi:hypothetical protein
MTENPHAPLGTSGMKARVMSKTHQTTIIAIFAALHAVLFLPEGPWRSFVIYLMPIEGIVLGPAAGFSSALLGSTIARLIKPTPYWMFGIIAEPLGVVAAAFLARQRWKETALIYGIMLAAYFVHPYGRLLPLWTILDLLAAFALIYPVSKIGKWVWESHGLRFPVAVTLIAFVSTVADSMTRVFMLVPGGLYSVLWPSYEAFISTFIAGAIESYIEDLFVCIATLVVGVPLLISLQKLLGLRQPLS